MQNFEPDPFLRSRRPQNDQNRSKTVFFNKKLIFVEVGPSSMLRLSVRPGLAGPGPARPGLAGQAWPNKANFNKNIRKYWPSFQELRLAFFIAFPIMSAPYRGGF